MGGVTGFSRGSTRDVVSAICAALAVPTLALAPSVGERGWVMLVIASILVAAAVFMASCGYTYGMAALFATTALKNATVPLGDIRVDAFISILVGVLLAGLLEVVKRRRFRIPRLSVLEWALLGPFAAGVWSLAASLDRATTLMCLLRLLVLWVAAIAASRALVDEAARRTALVAFIGAGTVLATFAIVQWSLPDLGIGVIHIQASALPGMMLIRPAGFYLDPNFLAAHLALTSLGALALAGVGGRARWWFVPAAVMLEGVVLTFSRSAWVALTLGLVILFVVGSRRSRLPLIGTLVVVIMVAGALNGPELLLSRVTSMLLFDDGSSTATRLFMAGSTVEMTFDRPVFGTGLGAYAEAYPEYRKPGALLRVTHPHQVPLALIAETGIAGLVAQIALFTVLLSVVLRRYRAGFTAVDVAVVTGFATLLVGSMLQYFLYFKPAWLLCGLLAAGMERPTVKLQRAE
ncbi:MAG: O-antigen ligase family protein [Coriobacteriia bacterium]|nr:O-antigen ligase family protein [Coriobacteriia bacterium]